MPLPTPAAGRTALAAITAKIPAPHMAALAAPTTVIQQLLDWIESAQTVLTQVETLIPSPAPDLQALRDQITALLS